MKTLKYLVWSVLSLTGIVCLLSILLFNIPSFQKGIAIKTSEFIEKQIGTPTRIEKIAFQPINQLVLQNIYLEDRSGDTLFAAKRMSIDFDILSLFKHSFRIYSAHIHTFICHLTRENTETSLNIQYIIDALKNPRKQETHTDIRIQNFSLKNGYFSYRVKNQKTTPHQFNPYDIQVSKINTTFQLKECTDSSLSAKILQLHLVEKSGFQVKKLSFDLSMNNRIAKINRLTLHLPTSHVKLKEIIADYSQTGLKGFFSKKTNFKLQIRPSKICLNELGSFFPVLTAWSDSLEIEGNLNGNPNTLRGNQLIIRKNHCMTVRSNVKLSHLNFLNSSNIFIQIHIQKAFFAPLEMQKIAKNLNLASGCIFKLIKRVGQISFDGDISGRPNHWNSNFNFQTQVGHLQASFSYNKSKTDSLVWKISSPMIHLNRLINNPYFDSAQVELSFSSTFSQWKNQQGSIDASVRGLKYRSSFFEAMDLTGDFTSNGFKGLLKINSPDGQIIAKGFFVLKGKDSEYDFSATLSKIDLEKLCLNSRYKNPTLSCQVNASIKGNCPENFVGNIAFRHLQFSANTLHFSMDSLQMEVKKKEENKKQWIVYSDLLQGIIEGNFSIKTIWTSFKHSVSTYLPSFIISEPFISENNINNLRWDLTINNFQKFSETFHLPMFSYQPIHVSGEYNGFSDHFFLAVNCPLINIKNHIIENGTIHLTNENHEIKASLSGVISNQEENELAVFAYFRAQNDSIYSLINWENHTDKTYSGRLDFTTHLSWSKEKFLNTFVQIYPSEFFSNHLVWRISPTTLTYDKKHIHVNQVAVQHNEQTITIDGNLSENEHESLKITLERVDLNYILRSLALLDALDFGGIVSGQIKIQDIFQTRQMSTHLDVGQFSFNKVAMGDLALKGQWSNEKKGVEMTGEIIGKKNDSIRISGLIYPVEEKMSIFFDAYQANIAFLQKYLDKVLPNLSGQLTGKMHLFGSLNNPTVEGKAWIQNGGFGIKFLNTHYTFNDWLSCTPNEISIRHFTFYDKYGNQTLVNASVHHDSFSHFRFTADFNYNSVLIFNANPITNPLLYGNVFATGKATISGNEKLVSIDVSLDNEKNSHLSFNFMQSQEIATCDFIHFMPKDKNNEKKKNYQTIINHPTNTEIKFNLLANINNGATLEMVVDPSSNNKISSVGNGHLQIQYGTKIPLKIFGKYTIEKGLYNFSLQQAFFRNFDIMDGSSIFFKGDPMKGELDAKASYSILANLNNLDQTLTNLSDSNRVIVRNQIPVNCVLLLAGTLEAPLIKWDLELPRANAELEHQIKSHIYPDDADMMNRQILYLLVMGCFYTPEYIRNKTKFNNNLSLLTSTLSSQVSNILGSLSNKIRIGATLNIQPSSDGERKNTTEFDLLLSGLFLNDQLKVNGNIGYMDRSSLRSSEHLIPIIGDCDIEYKLTKNGNIRLKGFNHYNYKINNLNPFLEMTQGLEILFQKDF